MHHLSNIVRLEHGTTAVHNAPKLAQFRHYVC